MFKFFRSPNFYDLLIFYKEKAEARGFSPKTIRVTETNLKMIASFLPLKTKLYRFNEKTYEDFLVKLRKSKYSRETIYDLNATLRKLINLANRKGLTKFSFSKIDENINLRISSEKELVSYSDFIKIAEYFKERREERFLLLFYILYYTGIRIGEALALTPSDFLNSENKKSGLIRINKAYLYEFNLIKETKNKKDRFIPVSRTIIREARRIARKYKIEPNERIFNFSPNAANLALKRVAKAMKIPEYHCHLFRHTYISNLVRKGVPLPVISSVSGDTQKTVLNRYSHMFKEDREIVLKALENIR